MRGYLSGLEYRAIRESLGLTQTEAAAFHGLKGVLTIKRWEAGRSFISQTACDKIVSLCRKFYTEQEELFRSLRKKEEEIVLTFPPEGGDFMASLERTKIKNLYVRLRAEGCCVRLAKSYPHD